MLLARRALSSRAGRERLAMRTAEGRSNAPFRVQGQVLELEAYRKKTKLHAGTALGVELLEDPDFTRESPLDDPDPSPELDVDVRFARQPTSGRADPSVRRAGF